MGARPATGSMRTLRGWKRMENATPSSAGTFCREIRAEKRQKPRLPAASPRGSHPCQAPRAGSGSCSLPGLKPGCGSRSAPVPPWGHSALCLELSPSLLKPPPPLPFASINFLHFRQIPHFLHQIKSWGQGQWKWEDSFHLLEMVGV